MGLEDSWSVGVDRASNSWLRQTPHMVSVRLEPQLVALLVILPSLVGRHRPMSIGRLYSSNRQSRPPRRRLTVLETSAIASTLKICSSML